MCPLWQVSPTSVPWAVLAWACGHRDSGQLQLSRPLLGNEQPSQQPKGVDTALHCLPGLDPVNTDGAGQAAASASESYFHSHPSGQDRQSPNQAPKEPRGRVAPGQQKVQRSGSEIHSRSNVQPVASSELATGQELSAVSCRGLEYCEQGTGQG